jgi:hypothetical protein
MIVGRMRIGDQHCRATNRGEFGHGRGAGAADHQMCPRQPRRDIIEKDIHLRGNAISLIGRRDGTEILRACLLTNPQQFAQPGWQDR